MSLPNKPNWLSRISIGVSIALVLALTTALNFKFDSAAPSDRASRLRLEGLQEARSTYSSYYFGRNRAQGSMPLAVDHLTGLKAMSALSDLTPDQRTLRSLAVLQSALGLSEWRQTLVRLRTSSGKAPGQAVERELAMWSQILAHERIAEQSEDEMRQLIHSMKLGWFEHLALAALHRSCGDLEAAKREELAAASSSVRTGLFALGNLVVSLVGTWLGVALFLIHRRLKLDPEAPVPAWFKFAPPRPLATLQADLLYVVFVLYLVSFAVIRIGVPYLAPSMSDSVIVPSQAIVRSACVTLLQLLTLVVPVLILILLRKRLDIRPETIGLRSQSIRLDILWGVLGYALLLPVLRIGTLVSSWLFSVSDSPINPAVSQFTGANNWVIQAMILFQAAALAPIIEEIMFRGVFFNALRPRSGRLWAVVISSAVFAILHPQLPAGFLGIFLLGIGFNCLYLVRGSLIPCIVAHSINNAMILLYLALAIGS